MKAMPDVISLAADQRMTFLRTFQSGEQSQLSQRLLNEVAAAKICLLNAKEKARYDAELARKTPPDAPPPLPTGDDSQSAFAAFAVGSQTESASSRSRGPTQDKAGLRKKKNQVPVVAIAVVILLVIVLVGLILWGKEKKGSERRKPVAAVEQPPRESSQAATPARKNQSGQIRGSPSPSEIVLAAQTRACSRCGVRVACSGDWPRRNLGSKAREKPEPAAHDQQRLAQRAKRKAARQAAAEKEIAEAEREAKRAAAARKREAERKAKEETRARDPGNPGQPGVPAREQGAR